MGYNIFQIARNCLVGATLDNKRLVFKPGNQWTKELEIAPFFAFPGWWRRFMYQVLTAREIVVYCYVCSLCDRYAIAYPSVEQICADLGVLSRVTVSRALERLQRLGFLLRGSDLIKGRLLSRRPVYQRPHPAHTLLTLLDMELIDAELFPNGVTRNKNDSSQGAVNLGLTKLLGNDLFHAYEIASPDAKSAVLHTALQQRLDISVSSARLKLSRVSPFISSSIAALIAADQGVPF